MQDRLRKMVLFLSQQFAKEITHETGVESSLEGGDIKEYQRSSKGSTPRQRPEFNRNKLTNIATNV